MKDLPSTIPRIESFDDLIGHEKVLAALREAFTRGQAHHAYLLSGPPGLGKGSAARVLGQSLLCQEHKVGYPCHRCPECIRVKAGSHPDWFEAEPGLPSIKIETIRRLSHDWNFRSFGGGYRCALMDDAERLTPEAANALLKLLEEPPVHSFFFLVTANRAQLLPTVVSRCQHVPFTPLTSEQVARVLTRLKVDPENLEAAAAFSSGSPGRALALLKDQAFSNHKELFRDFLALLQPGVSAVLSFGAWAEAVDTQSRSSGSALAAQRDHTHNLLEMLRFLLRDLVSLKAGASSDRLLAPYLASPLHGVVEQLTWTRLWAMLIALREAEQALTGNVTPRLVLENLAVQVARA